MFNLKNKKDRTLFICMLVSFVVLLTVFYATDGLTGDKEFSEYTRQDWAVAIVPLSVIVVSLVSTLTFATIIMVSFIRMCPVLADYTANQKFAHIDADTEFFAFDHNEFKRACCRTQNQTGVWISIKEYSLKTRSWTVLEEGRFIQNADELREVLQRDYGYDRVKFYNAQDFL